MARMLGNSLIVAVQEDEYVRKTKNDTVLKYPLAVRMEMVFAFREVDYVISYQDVSKTIKKAYFDVFAIGEDQNHIGFQEAVEWCKNNNKSVERMCRTEGISSSTIKALKIDEDYFYGDICIAPI